MPATTSHLRSRPHHVRRWDFNALDAGDPDVQPAKRHVRELRWQPPLDVRGTWTKTDTQFVVLIVVSIVILTLVLLCMSAVS